MRNTITLCLLLGTTLIASFEVEAARKNRNNDNVHGYYQAFGGYVTPTGNKTIIVDPNTHAWAAYEGDGQLIRWGRASLGKNWCADTGKPCRTVTGTFTIFSKKGSGCKSSKFPLPRGGAPMPYCMHFHKGFAIHGSNAVPNHNASHGCIRVPVADARWLNQEFAEHGTRVIVRPYGAAAKKHYTYEEEQQVNPNYQQNYRQTYRQVNENYSNADGYYDEGSRTVYVYSDSYVNGSIF